MKILYICNEYPPYPHGGIGTFTETLAEMFAQHGHMVWVLGHYPQIDQVSDRRNKKNIQVIRLKEKNFPFHQNVANLLLYKEAAAIIRNREIDIVEAPDYLGITALWPRLPVPLVLRVHGSATVLATAMRLRPSKKIRFLEKRALARASAIVAVSLSAAHQARIAFDIKQNPSIIYNGVRIDNTCPGYFRKEKKIIFCGTLMRLKGVYSLIKAWPLVHKVHPEAQLHFFGKDSNEADGSSVKNNLCNLLPANCLNTVFFHGQVARQSLQDEYRTATALVQPSYSESFSMTPLEAMAWACPVVFTANTSGPELIKDGQNGLLVDPSDHESIAEKIEHLLSDQEFVMRIGKAGRQTIEKRFTLEHSFLQNEAFYRSVLAKTQKKTQERKIGEL